MEITVISDTHGDHEKLGVLSGDVLIHCGDLFNQFEVDPQELEKIDLWFGRQEFSLILCIGGNHDFRLEDLGGQTPTPFQNAEYLQDDARSFNEVNFYGAPWVPDLPGQAFDLDACSLAGKWNQIPDSTDVLITHTPPRGVLDVPVGRTRRAVAPSSLNGLSTSRPSCTVSDTCTPVPGRRRSEEQHSSTRRS